MEKEQFDKTTLKFCILVQSNYLRLRSEGNNFTYNSC